MGHMPGSVLTEKRIVASNDDIATRRTTGADPDPSRRVPRLWSRHHQRAGTDRLPGVLLDDHLGRAFGRNQHDEDDEQRQFGRQQYSRDRSRAQRLGVKISQQVRATDRRWGVEVE